MNTRYVSNYTDDEKAKCVNQYLNGENKEQLAQIWGVSERTIERWIKEYERTDAIKIKIAKRSKTIPIDIQHEIMEILNSNAILYGFNISTWNEVRIIKLLMDKYNIKITRYMAKELLRDAKYFSMEYEEKTFEDINKLEEQGCKLILLDYIRIGQIKRRNIEGVFYKKFEEDRVNVNLGIARGVKRVYIEVILSEGDIIEKVKSINLNEIQAESDSKQRKIILDDKFNFTNKVVEKESNGRKVIFITTGDPDLNRFKNKNKNTAFSIVKMELYKQLVQDDYEKDECNDGERYSLIQHLYNSNNNYIWFDSFEEIREYVAKKILNYVNYPNKEIEKWDYIANCLKIGSKVVIF